MLRKRIPRAWLFVVVSAILACSGSAQTEKSVPTWPGTVRAADSWLRSLLSESGCSRSSGRYVFAIALSTGNMESDPVHAEAMRRLVSIWLNATVVPGDTVIVSGGEHRIWQCSPPILITNDIATRRKAFSLLPYTSEPRSRGGKSIERILADLASRVTRPTGVGAVLLVISNSWSQNTPTNLSEHELQSVLRARGFGAIWREVFSVPTPDGVRSVYVALTISCTQPTTGVAAPRAYRDDWREWVPNAYTPVSVVPRSTRPTVTTQTARTVVPVMDVIILLATVITSSLVTSWLIGRRSRMSRSAPEGEPHWEQPGNSNAPALDEVLRVADRHAAALKALQENMEEDAGRISNSADALCTLVSIRGGGEEIGHLRSEIAAMVRRLDEWDQTAIAYLQSLEAAVRHPDIDERQRRVWQKAADDFCRYAARHGFTRIAPKSGDPYVPDIHRAVEYVGDAAAATTIDQCVRWGYQNGAKVYHPAEVRVRP